MSNFCSSGGAAFTSDKDDWETPQKLFDELDASFHFTLDPASSDSNFKVAKHYTKQDDGLSKDWGGEVVFCNPPYGREIPKWARKCFEESKKPGTTVVLLVPSRTDTKWFHDYIYGKCDQLIFIKGRLKFEVGGEKRDAAPFPSLLAIYESDER